MLEGLSATVGVSIQFWSVLWGCPFDFGRSVCKCRSFHSVLGVSCWSLFRVRRSVRQCWSVHSILERVSIQFAQFVGEVIFCIQFPSDVKWLQCVDYS